MLDLDALDFHALKALLDWQVEMGATEAIGDAPVNRYAAPPVQTGVQTDMQTGVQTGLAAPAALAATDPVAEAKAAAAAAGTLEELAAAMATYDHCELKRGARQLVFADGDPRARLMIVGEAPGRDEDR